MPIATKYLPPNSQYRKVKGDFTNIELNDRIKLIDRNQDFYDGHYQEFLVDDWDTNVKNNLAINMVRQIIDRTISFIFPSTPKFEIDSNSAEETPDEIFLRNTYEANGDVTFLSMVAHNGATGGHCFVRIVEPDEFAEDGGQYPQLINIDPRTIQVYWNSLNMKQVLWYELNYVDAEGAQYIEDVVLNKELKRWDIFTYKRSGVQGAGWRKIATDRWDSILSPIVDWQHLPNPNRYFGLSEVSEDVERLNDTINRVASDIGLILRYHASPRTIAVGVVETEVKQTSVDGLWSIASPDAEVFNLEMKSDLASSMQFLTYLNDAVLAEARVVIMHGSVKDFQRVTNTGIRAVFLDMLAKNELLRSNYSKALKKISRRILLVGGKDEQVIPTIIWADPLPADQTEIVNVLSIEKAMGIVSRETIAKKRGYNWNDELKRMQTENTIFAKMQAEMQPEEKKPAGGGGGAAPIKKDENEVKR